MIFEPISLDRQKEYLGRLNGSPQVTSDYSFLNLLQYIWAYVLTLDSYCRVVYLFTVF